MRRFFFFLPLLMLPLFVLPLENGGEAAANMEEETAGEEVEETLSFFPAALFFEKAEYAAGGCWEPDWPLYMPPDAFKLSLGDWISITVDVDEKSFCLGLDEDGFPLEFPCVFRGELVQASLVYSSPPSGSGKALASAVIGGLVKLDILEYNENYPSLIRVEEDSTFSFVILRRGINFISESWFDEEGLFLGAYEYRLTQVFPPGGEAAWRILDYEFVKSGEKGLERRGFDSRYMLTSVSGQSGEFSAAYFLENIPKYWARYPLAPKEDEPLLDTENTDDTKDLEKPGRYSLQWDENGLLQRLVMTQGGGPEEESFFDSRYEYTLDNMGNWIERREIKMSRILGYLVSGPGSVIRRIPVYKTEPLYE